jgi:putative transposase
MMEDLQITNYELRITETQSPEGMWCGVKEAAERLRISRQAVLKGITKGKYKTRNVAGRNQHGVSYEIWCEATTDNHEATTDNHKATTDNHKATTDNHEATTDNHEATTAEPTETTEATEIEVIHQEVDEASEPGQGARPAPLRVDTLPSAAAVPARSDWILHTELRKVPACAGMTTDETSVATGARMMGRGEISPYVVREENLPVVVPSVAELPEKYDRQARLRAGLVNESIMNYELRIKNSEDSKATIRCEFLEMYNNGLICRELYEIEGRISERTLYRWQHDYKLAKQDYRVLANCYFEARSKSKDLGEDLNMCLAALLDQNAPTVGAVLNYWMLHYQKQQMEPPVSKKTMERRINTWMSQNRPLWLLARDTEKNFDECVLPTISMDRSLIEFGQMLMSDGHTLNFDVINSKTGKAGRPTLITFFEAASRFPVSYGLTWGESAEAIADCFYNAIMFSQFVPLSLKLDQGHAYKKLAGLKRELEAYEQACEGLRGLFLRAGVAHVSFCKKYNAKGKAPVERFFGNMGNSFEVFVRSYRGNCIDNKPAYLHRNEKWQQKIKDTSPITEMELKQALEYWTFEVYGMLPHRGLDGRQPYEVYQEGRAALPLSRIVNPNDYLYLLLTKQVKKVSSHGVVLNKITYWSPELIGYVSSEVVVRTQPLEDRYVLCYTRENEFICQATAEVLTHQLAAQAGELEKGVLAAKMKQHRQLKTAYKRSLMRFKADLSTNLLMHDSNHRRLLLSGGDVLEAAAVRGRQEVEAVANDPITKAMESGIVEEWKGDEVEAGKGNLDTFLKEIGI